MWAIKAVDGGRALNETIWLKIGSGLRAAIGASARDLPDQTCPELVDRTVGVSYHHGHSDREHRYHQDVLNDGLTCSFPRAFHSSLL